MAHIRKPVQTKSGLRYPVAWRDPDGTFREKRFVKESEAKAYAKAVDTDMRRGRYLDDRQGKQTFKEVAAEWLDTRTRARPITVAKYRSLLETWAYPEFGSRRVETIKPGDVGRFVNKLKEAPLANGRPGTMRPSTIRRVLWPVSAVLDFAAEQEYIRRNPAKGVALPTEESLGVEPFSGRAWSWTEVTRIADAASKSDPMHGLLVRFLPRTGLRASEVAGLRIRDVEDGRLQVRETCTRDSKAANGLRYGKPKSKNSRRTLHLDPGITAELQAHIDRHPRQDEPDAPLFPSRFCGGEWSELRNVEPFDWSRPIDPGTFRRNVFVPACTSAGVTGRARLHDLRHTCGSLMLAAGVPLFEVSRFLGHASADFTAKQYGHVLPTSAIRNAERFAAYCEAESTGTVVPMRKKA